MPNLIYWIVGLMVKGLSLPLRHDPLTVNFLKNSTEAQGKIVTPRDRLLHHQARIGYTGILMGAFITLLHIAY